MKTYARIQDGRVAEFIQTDGDIAEMFHPDLTFVDCTSVAGIAEGWTYSGSTFGAPVPTLSELIAYAASKQQALANGGFTLTVGGQSMTFATDPASDLRMTGKVVRLQQAGAPTANFTWPLANGAGVSVAPAVFLAAGEKIADFIQATSDALVLTAVPGIEGGSITTFAQVDAIFAAVANHA